MRKLLLVIITLNIIPVAFSQGIRKSYDEMTALERINLVNAFYQLRNGPDLINELAVYHGEFFNFDDTEDPTRLDIHFNLPDEPEREVFFAWHRQSLLELERAMQNINPFITIPYWNSSLDQATNSQLWDNNFMGQFNTDWTLNRNLGGNDQLPMPSEVNQVQSLTDFFLYSDLMERGPVHHGAHRWVGGAMSSTASPRDPVFFLHHAYIDKLWQEWQDLRGGSSYLRNSMLRYDGTYTFAGQTLSLVNPNNIVDGRFNGIFYADKQLAELDSYSVTNATRNPEVFFYQFDIVAGNNFTIPANRSARIESLNGIRLLPGFRAIEGSSFIASIGNGSELKDYPTIIRNQRPWDNRGIPINWDAYLPQDEKMRNIGEIGIYPNPFSDRITLISKESYDNWVVEIYDLQGRRLAQAIFGSGASVTLDKEISNLSPGAYHLKVLGNGSSVKSSTIIKH
jgi:tyrosinase